MADAPVDKRRSLAEAIFQSPPPPSAALPAAAAASLDVDLCERLVTHPDVLARFTPAAYLSRALCVEVPWRALLAFVLDDGLVAHLGRIAASYTGCDLPLLCARIYVLAQICCATGEPLPARLSGAMRAPPLLFNSKQPVSAWPAVVLLSILSRPADEIDECASLIFHSSEVDALLELCAERHDWLGRLRHRAELLEALAADTAAAAFETTILAVRGTLDNRIPEGLSSHLAATMFIAMVPAATFRAKQLLDGRLSSASIHETSQKQPASKRPPSPQLYRTPPCSQEQRSPQNREVGEEGSAPPPSAKEQKRQADAAAAADVVEEDEEEEDEQEQEQEEESLHAEQSQPAREPRKRQASGDTGTPTTEEAAAAAAVEERRRKRRERYEREKKEREEAAKADKHWDALRASGPRRAGAASAAAAAAPRRSAVTSFATSRSRTSLEEAPSSANVLRAFGRPLMPTTLVHQRIAELCDSITDTALQAELQQCNDTFQQCVEAVAGRALASDPAFALLRETARKCEQNGWGDLFLLFACQILTFVQSSQSVEKRQEEWLEKMGSVSAVRALPSFESFLRQTVNLVNQHHISAPVGHARLSSKFAALLRDTLNTIVHSV